MNEYQIARNTCTSFILSKKEFSYQELQQEIIKRNGILRVSFGVTIADHLQDLEEDGIIKHILGTTRYEVLNNCSK